MKNLTVFALSMLSVNAFAASKSKPMTYNDFRKAAVEAAQNVTGDDCKFTAVDSPAGLKLMIDSGKAKAEVLVPPGAQIVDKEQSDGDDSVSSYHIVNAGDLDITNASDAYYRVTLSNEDGQASCEVDF